MNHVCMFMICTVQNGYVQLSYRSKSDLKEITASDHRVDDNVPHTVIIRLSRERISVELDDRVTDFKEVNNRDRLQTHGNIYIGLLATLISVFIRIRFDLLRHISIRRLPPQ